MPKETYRGVSLKDKSRMAESWIKEQNHIVRNSNENQEVENLMRLDIRRSSWFETSSLCGSTSLSVSSYSSESPTPPHNEPARMPNFKQHGNTKDKQTKTSNQKQNKMSKTTISLQLNPKKSPNINIKNYKMDRVMSSPTNMVVSGNFLTKDKQSAGERKVERLYSSVKPNKNTMNGSLMDKRSKQEIKPTKVFIKHPENAVIKQNQFPTNTNSTTSGTPDILIGDVVSNKPKRHSVYLSTKQVYYPVIVEDKDLKEEDAVLACDNPTQYTGFGNGDFIVVNEKGDVKYERIPEVSNKPSSEINNQNHNKMNKDIKLIVGGNDFNVRDKSLPIKISKASRKSAPKSKLKLLWPPRSSDEDEPKQSKLAVKPPKDFVSPIALGDKDTLRTDFLSSNSVSPNVSEPKNLDEVRTPIAELQKNLAGAISRSVQNFQHKLNIENSSVSKEADERNKEILSLPPLNKTIVRKQKENDEKQMENFGSLVKSSPMKKLQFIPLPPTIVKTNFAERQPRRHKVIHMDPDDDERCSHTIVPPSKMMTLAMELHLSKDGKAKKLFQEAKIKAEGDLLSDNETNLPELWVVQKEEISSGSEEVMATHLSPVLSEEKVVQEAGDPEQQFEKTVEKDEDFSVEALVGAPDTLYKDSSEDEGAEEGQEGSDRHIEFGKENEYIGYQDKVTDGVKEEDATGSIPTVFSSKTSQIEHQLTDEICHSLNNIQGETSKQNSQITMDVNTDEPKVHIDVEPSIHENKHTSVDDVTSDAHTNKVQDTRQDKQAMREKTTVFRLPVCYGKNRSKKSTLRVL